MAEGTEFTIDYLVTLIDQMREALIWCGGSPSFAPEDGEAFKGWTTTVAPVIAKAYAVTNLYETAKSVDAREGVEAAVRAEVQGALPEDVAVARREYDRVMTQGLNEGHDQDFDLPEQSSSTEIAAAFDALIAVMQRSSGVAEPGLQLKAALATTREVLRNEVWVYRYVTCDSFWHQKGHSSHSVCPACSKQSPGTVHRMFKPNDEELDALIKKRAVRVTNAGSAMEHFASGFVRGQAAGGEDARLREPLVDAILDALSNADDEDTIGSCKVYYPADGYPAQSMLRAVARARAALTPVESTVGQEGTK